MKRLTVGILVLLVIIIPPICGCTLHGLNLEVQDGRIGTPSIPAGTVEQTLLPKA